MFTPDDAREAQWLFDRLLTGSVSREDWSALAAIVLLTQGPEVVDNIVEAGLDEFIRVSRPIYEGHGFQYDDYRRIFDRLRARTGIRH